MVRTRRTDLIGRRFGRLVVIGDAGYTISSSGRKVYKMMCQCDCGNTVAIRPRALMTGNTTSCGCYKHEYMIKRNSTHGLCKHKLYRVWSSMKDRCSRPGCVSYVNYGQRNIRVCDEWVNDFDEFYKWAMENGYQNGLTIDRIDNSLGYSPQNCRFITRAAQNRNRRYCHVITHDGQTKTLSEWSRIYHFDRKCFRDRVTPDRSESDVLAEIIARKTQ